MIGHMDPIADTSPNELKQLLQEGLRILFGNPVTALRDRGDRDIFGHLLQHWLREGDEKTRLAPESKHRHGEPPRLLQRGAIVLPIPIKCPASTVVNL